MHLLSLSCFYHDASAALLSEGPLDRCSRGRALLPQETRPRLPGRCHPFCLQQGGISALGNRSILADPRPAEMKDLVNTKIKFREPYRPFAPSVLAERAAEK